MSETERGRVSLAAAAAAFLATRSGAEVSDIALVGRQGEWSTAFSFRQGDAARIIRFSALDEDFARDRLAAQFAAPDLPIPVVIELGEAPGGYYAISERSPGGFLDDLDGAGIRAILPALFAALDAARIADLSRSTGFGNWGSDGNAPHPTWRAALLDIANDPPEDRCHGWREHLQDSPAGAGPFDEALAVMRDLLAWCPEDRHLVHGDLLNFNVLTAGGRISAVIDWGCSLYGDFLYDIAWFCYWAPWYERWTGIDVAQEATAHYAAIGLAVPHLEERLRCYQIHIGLADQAYNAFRERWDRVATGARRTAKIAGTR